jgi:hypothetical protein
MLIEHVQMALDAALVQLTHGGVRSVQIRIRSAQRDEIWRRVATLISTVSGDGRDDGEHCNSPKDDVVTTLNRQSSLST